MCVDEVKHIIGGMKTGSCHGLDGLSYEVYQHPDLINHFASELANVFNFGIEHNYLPKGINDGLNKTWKRLFIC